MSWTDEMLLALCKCRHARLDHGTKIDTDTEPCEILDCECEDYEEDRLATELHRKLCQHDDAKIERHKPKWSLSCGLCGKTLEGEDDEN